MDDAMTQAEPVTHGNHWIPNPQPPQDERITQVDNSQADARYANFCRLSGAPEELLMDFGFDSRPGGDQAHAIAVTQRIITGWQMAKNLLSVLQLTVQRHEAAFGELEIGIHQRASRTQGESTEARAEKSPVPVMTGS